MGTLYLLCGHELVFHGNVILISWPQNTKLWLQFSILLPRISILWPRSSISCTCYGYIVATIYLFFLTMSCQGLRSAITPSYLFWVCRSGEMKLTTGHILHNNSNNVFVMCTDLSSTDSVFEKQNDIMSFTTAGFKTLCPLEKNALHKQQLCISVTFKYDSLRALCLHTIGIHVLWESYFSPTKEFHFREDI